MHDRAPWVVIAAGGAAIAVGVFGLALGWGQSSGADNSGSTRGTTTTGPSREQPAAFLADFVQALRSGDTAFLGSRLAPAVIARYGDAACRAAIPLLVDPTAALTLRSTSQPAAYTYTSDGLSVTVPDVTSFAVDGVLDGQPATRELHFALVDGRYRIFLDCGTPLPGAP